jgi:hypothetical protein
MILKSLFVSERTSMLRTLHLPPRARQAAGMANSGDGFRTVHRGGEVMDNWTFGFTMLVVGMGGTLAALGALAVMMALLKKIFPVKEESK